MGIGTEIIATYLLLRRMSRVKGEERKPWKGSVLEISQEREEKGSFVVFNYCS